MYQWLVWDLEDIAFVSMTDDVLRQKHLDYHISRAIVVNIIGHGHEM